MTFALYTCCNPISRSAQISVDILELEWQQVEIMFDLPLAMKHAKGKISPVDGWIIVTGNGETLTSIYHVVDFINKHGLRLI